MTNNLTGRMAAAMRNAVLLSLTLLLTSSNSFLRSARSLHPSYQSYVCTCLQTEGTKTLESSRVLRIHDTSLTSFRGNKFVSPVMEDRLKRGLLTSADLDRMFSLSESEMEIIDRKSTVGFLGCIFDLDTAMVDLQKVYLYGYATLAGDLKQTPPTSAQVRDVIGSSLREAIITLGWTVPLEANILRFEQRFYEILEKFVEAIPVTPVPGVAALIDEAIRDGNKITVLTQLPRPVAIQILKKAGLSPLFQGRIDPENLISPMHLADFKSTSTANAAADAQAAQRASIESQNRAQSARAASSGERNASLSVSSLGDREGLRFDGAAVIKCCGLMRKPGALSVLLSANRRNILSAKRMGLTVIGIQGYSQLTHELRAADKVILSLESLALKDLYTIARRGIKMSKGPDQQTQTAAAPVLSITRSVSAPAMTEDRSPKDTFADEFGSDIM